jgi:hypothetical protein
MTKALSRLATPLLVALCGAVLLAQGAPGDVDSDVDAARAAAGPDFRNTFLNLYMPPGGRNGPARAGGAGQARTARGAPEQTPDRATWYAPPFRIFDNFY